MSKMTNIVNRDLKRLWKMHKDSPSLNDIEEVLKPELKRLYHLQPLDELNIKSVLILVVLNRKYHVIPYHQFGFSINEENLL